MKKRYNRVATNLWRCEQTGIYYVWAKIGGRQLRQSLKTDNPKLAKGRRDQVLATWGRVQRGGGALPFEAALTSYINAEVLTRALKPKSAVDVKTIKDSMLKTWPLGRLGPLEAITEDICRKWNGRRVREVNWQRANRELCLLKNMLNWAVKHQHLMINPASGIEPLKVRRTIPVIPTHAEYEAILANVRHRGYHDAADALELLARSGLRIGEAGQLLWEDVSEGLTTITLRRQGEAHGSPKSGSQRVLQVNPRLQDVLRRIAEKHGRSGRIMKHRTCGGALRTTCRKLGLRKYTHHSLRRYFISWCVEASIDFQTISAWVGHSDGGVLVAKDYSHLRDEHAKAMAAKLT